MKSTEIKVVVCWNLFMKKLFAANFIYAELNTDDKLKLMLSIRVKL